MNLKNTINKITKKLFKVEVFRKKPPVVYSRPNPIFDLLEYNYGKKDTIIEFVDGRSIVINKDDIASVEPNYILLYDKVGGRLRMRSIINTRFVETVLTVE